MAKQYDLFGFEIVEDDPQGYTKKVQTVTYTPSDKKPHLLECLDDRKTKSLIARINKADISDDEKKFLKAAGSTREKSVKMVLLETLSAHQEGLTAEAAIEKTMAAYTGTSDRALMEAKWSLSGDEPKLNAQMKNANITFKDDKEGVRRFFRAAEVVAEPAKA